MIYSAYSSDSAHGMLGYLGKDLKSQEKRPGEFKFLAREAKKSGGPVLELASGACRVLMALSKAGFEVYGIEASRAMIDIGREAIRKNLSKKEQRRIHLIQGDMCSFAFRKSFPLIIIPFCSFWYNFERNHNDDRSSERATRIEHVLGQADNCLKSIMSSLSRGGRFIIDSSNYSSYFQEELGKSWWDMVAEKHGFRFKVIRPYGEPVKSKNGKSKWYEWHTEVLIGGKL